ncbi:hypothetical protein QMK33_04550 [Hymenobacter sp. H14-R3]|uniref:DUF6056 family protein n=1 Tax=Hymenobacter sp. H14-R3 TaxID=3046308 RepID=UPI0024B9804E|nr:DUF6056 family protein [Hymenobacter sp. H14-R3]MDJ0364411.1 hypothetical protein [Hymenobacter sp. H14-R3]
MPRPAALFSFLAALGCVLPFLGLAFYSHAALDDYAIGTALRATDIFSYTWGTYVNWSGRYSASLFSAIHQLFDAHPAWYPYLIFGFISLFVSSLFAAVVVLVPGLPTGRLLAGSVVLVTGLSAFPWPAEGIFWLTGAVAYLTPLIMSCWLLILLATFYAAPAGPQWGGWWLLGGLIGFFIAGFSEVMALLLLLVGSAVWAMPTLRPFRREAHWAGAAIAVGCLLTLAAPGNFHRLGIRPSIIQVGNAAVLAALSTGYLLLNWVGNALLLALTLLLLPIIQATARYPGRSLLNRLVAGPSWLWPLLLGAGLFGTTWFCYAAQGIGPALRVKNLLYFYFLLCWFLSVCAAIKHHGPSAQLRYPAGPGLYVGGALLLSCLFFTDHNQNLVHAGIGRAPNTVVQAYRDWLGGDAARYHAAQLTRYRIMRTTQQDSVRLPDLPVHPVTIFYSDISCNPALWGNRAYAQFFHRKAAYAYLLP